MRALFLLPLVHAGPVQKIIQLLGGMQTKAIKEGEVEQANFEEMQRWCERQSIDLKRTIAEEKKQITSANAQIETAESNIEQLKAAISELSANISQNEKEAKEATELRNGDKSAFQAKDKELSDTIDTLTRAIRVLKKHVGGSFLQTANSNLQVVQQALGALVHSSFISLEDKDVIGSLLQSETKEEEFSLQPQATVSNYDSKSGGILDTFESLKEKAQATRNQAQKDEMKANMSYQLLIQSAKDEIKALEHQLDEAKKKMSRSEETKATATGDLQNVTKDLAADTKSLDDTQRECMNAATEFETSQKSRAEELGVLANAKQVLSSAALVQTSSPMSFLQTRQLQDRQLQAAAYLRSEGNRLNSMVLQQIGSKIQADPFSKVSAMINQMVERLQKEASGEADQHAWCTSETVKTKKSLELKGDKLEDMTVRYEQAQSASAQLGEQIKALTKGLAAMDRAQSEATALRQKEHAEFEVKSKDLSEGQQACASAIKILKDYYQGDSFLQQPAGSASSGIVGMLEVAEADFSRNLAEATTAEDQAQTEYEQMLQDNRVSKAAKESDIKNKNSSIKRLATQISETQLDVTDARKEQSAVQEYADELKKNCETKVPTFEERQKRRQEEVDGLRNALEILGGKSLLEVGGDLLSGFE